MKKSIIVFALGFLMLGASCGRRYTCPTYLKNNTEPQNERAQETPKSTDENKKS